MVRRSDGSRMCVAHCDPVLASLSEVPCQNVVHLPDVITCCSSETNPRSPVRTTTTTNADTQGFQRLSAQHRTTVPVVQHDGVFKAERYNQRRLQLVVEVNAQLTKAAAPLPITSVRVAVVREVVHDLRSVVHECVRVQAAHHRYKQRMNPQHPDIGMLRPQTCQS